MTTVNTEATEIASRILQDKLGCEASEIAPDVLLSELGADSLDKVEIVMEVEKAISKSIPDDDSEINTVQDVMNLVVKYKPTPIEIQQCQVEKRRKLAESFMKEILNVPGVSIEVLDNDDSEKESTSFEVRVSNETNSNVSSLILRVDDFKRIDLLQGEDFKEDVHQQDVLRYMFLCEFLTLQEI